MRTATRSGRQVKRSKWLNDYQLLQATGRHAEADYLERQAPVDDVEIEDPITLLPGEAAIFGCIMLQLSLKQGLKRWGKKGADSALKEMTQMHDMNAFFTRDVKTLTREQRVRALSSIIFLKEKHTGEIKSRTCVNGAPQRAYIPKEDAAAPTAATDSVMMVGAVNAHERRDVSTMDIPGADKVDDGEVVIEHMPGDDLWADVLSKPSTGKRFFVDRSHLQKIAVNWADETL